MPLFDEKHVKIEGCIVVYDGMNRPNDPNSKGNVKRSLRVVIDPNNPDVGVLQQLANNELQQSKFKGVLPQGGFMPVNAVQADKLNGMYTGWPMVNCSTFRMPDVYDENGGMLTDPMQYLHMIYPGQIVDVLVHCKEYDEVSKGIAARMDGFMIKSSQNAPRQNFGSGGINTSGAFGGQQPQNQNQNQQNNGGGYQPQNQNQNQQNNGGGPNQAHNYLPPNNNNNR